MKHSFSEANVDSLRYLIIGFTSGEIPKIALNLLLLKGASLVGVYCDESKRPLEDFDRDREELFAWVKEGRLKPPILHEYKLENVREGLRDLRDRSYLGRGALVFEAFLEARSRGGDEEAAVVLRTTTKSQL